MSEQKKTAQNASINQPQRRSSSSEMKRARPQTPSSSTAKTYQRVGCDRDIVGRILLEWFASDEASFTGGAKIATITVSVNAARTAGDSGYTNAITGRQVSFFLRNKAPKERVRCPTTSGTGLFLSSLRALQSPRTQSKLMPALRKNFRL